MTPSTQFIDLLALMARLRTDCPWDAKQTHASLQKYALEEVFELIDAIQNDDQSPNATQQIKSELGDVLLQVVFHAQLYEEEGRFGMGDVIDALQQKLIQRHPHVFGDEVLTTQDEVKRRWDEIKTEQNQHKPKRLLSQVKPGTALMTAQSLNQVSDEAGFGFDGLEAILGKLHEELTEFYGELPQDFDDKIDQLTALQKTKISDELGDVLFVLTNVARHLQLDAEMVLQSANAKFKRRFGFVEDQMLALGKGIHEGDAKQLDEFWQQAKSNEHKSNEHKSNEY